MRSNAAPQRSAVTVFGIEMSLAIIKIHRRHRAEHVDEISGGREARLDLMQIRLKPGAEGIGRPAIGLRATPFVEPRFLRRAVGVECDVIVGKAGRVRIKIDVVIVGAKENPMAFARLDHGTKIIHVALRGG